MKYSSVIFFTVLFCMQLMAQKRPDQTLAKNGIQVTVSNLVLYGTIKGDYERQIAVHAGKRNYYTYVRAGYGGFATWGMEGRVTSLSINRIYGNKNAHFEIGLGVAHLFDKLGYEIGVSNANYPTAGFEREPKRSEYYIWLPAFDLGYRYQSLVVGLSSDQESARLKAFICPLVELFDWGIRSAIRYCHFAILARVLSTIV